MHVIFNADHVIGLLANWFCFFQAVTLEMFDGGEYPVSDGFGDCAKKICTTFNTIASTFDTTPIHFIAFNAY